jgi:hypothetical protein
MTTYKAIAGGNDRGVEHFTAKTDIGAMRQVTDWMSATASVELLKDVSGHKDFESIARKDNYKAKWRKL